MTGPLRSDLTALDAIVRLMGPEGGSQGSTRRYAVLPSRRRPRYLVPVSGRAGAGAHLRPGTGRGATASRAAVRGVLRTGGGRLLPGGIEVTDGTATDPSLRRHLARLVGSDDVEVAVALGAPRPNRKPVIQILAADGTTVGWAKLGADVHTDALVAHETEALALRPGPPVRVPEVLASDRWHGHPLLVLAHMELHETPGNLRLTADAVRAVAGPITDEPAASSRWWSALRAEAAAGVDPEGAVAARLDELAVALGERRWPFGRWHGDLAPWNASWDGGQLLLWDWERSGGPVPLGLDVVHNLLQVALLRDGADLDAAVAGAHRDAGDLLCELGHRAEDVELVVAAYLAILRVRYAGDAHLGALGPGAPIAAALDAVAPARSGTSNP